MSSVAVVILNWNGKKFLEKFLPILHAYTPQNQAMIYVADNASSDGSVEFLNKNFPDVKLLIFGENYGFAGGYNKALEQISSDYYLLLNSDVEVTENWLTPLIEYLENHTDTAALQPKIISFSNRKSFEYAGAAGGFIDKYGYPFCRGRIFGTIEDDDAQYDSTIDIFWATGACLFIRSKDFHETGGFDENFFAHQEEIDLCWRLRSRGRKIACVAQSVVYHVGGGTLNVESPFKTYLNFRNNLLMLYKNLPEKKLQKTMLLRWFFDYLAAFQMFISGKKENAKMVFKARKEFKQIKKNFLPARLHNQSLSQNKKIAEIFDKSIVLQYYLHKKHFFSQL
jgi:GT2 family glycosyltransferase